MFTFLSVQKSQYNNNTYYYINSIIYYLSTYSNPYKQSKLIKMA